MPFFVWSSAFSVGVAHLDEQHRTIFDLMERMYDSLASGNASMEIDRMSRMLVELRDCADTHFTDEEGLLVSIGYHELDTHKAMHRCFVQQLDEFRHCQCDGGVALNISLLLFLRDWLLNHILQEDRKYRDFLAARTPDAAKPSVP